MLPEFQSSTSHAVVAWGRKPSATRAQLWANFKGLALIYSEDGFLRSYAPSPAFSALSWVLDEEGVHYDCTRPSQLETLLNSSQDVSVPQQGVALQFMLQHLLSKYNHAPTYLLGETFGSEAVLVVDQTYGDLSVSYGAANARSFQHMLQAALAENPDATIYVKTHPQTASGHKRGYLTHVPPHPRVVLLTQAINPMQLLAHMRRVYVVSSTMGFEALLMGKPVVCFGVPWYAGWGATDDRCTHSPAASRRSRKRCVSELFAAAYLHYAKYLNPITHQRGGVMDVMPWLVL